MLIWKTGTTSKRGS